MNCHCCNQNLPDTAKVALCPPCFQTLKVSDHFTHHQQLVCKTHINIIDPQKVTR